MNRWIWTGVALLVALVIGYIACVFTWPRWVVYVEGTNTNVSQTVGHIDNPTDVEKNEIELLTNSITHPRFVNSQKGFKLSVTFSFDYRLSSGTALPMSWSETYNVPEQDFTGWIFGGGWDIMRTAPAVLAGYHWRNLGVLGTVTISTNFGLAVFGIWIF